ncbi:P-type conjugative transfer protein VirB9 [Sulfuriferula sp.]|uniref:P-type conjugative transfer protein VirB9 n=1 Tax=Sulfuriferula sp. TaxID=2025307 RepID=UPI002731C5E8|nr:P-type conjugative transfer protein VirB9 [Sulfuriferula sp.]MDP2027524.1 P-type conjugative transfer protein VirB9 [Sulfuriferula sp.]
MKRLILIALLVPSLALAELTPKQGAFDPRVRVVDYNPLNVVKLSTFYGVSTHVQFADGENIIDVAVGDDQAWKIVPRGNHLFIKPQATKADTNVTVVTDKRTYQFALVVQPRRVSDSTAWSDPNLIFSLSFRYPDDEAAQLARTESKQAVKARLNEVKAKLTDATKAGQNFDYWVAGSEEISPTAARDDGRFIYLTFSNNRDMPAVYSVDAKGNEALINTNVIDGNTIVIQRLVSRLILRKGEAVASVINKSFDLNGGIDNTTGTVASNVERVVKGAKQ